MNHDDLLYQDLETLRARALRRVRVAAAIRRVLIGVLVAIVIGVVLVMVGSTPDGAAPVRRPKAQIGTAACVVRQPDGSIANCN